MGLDVNSERLRISYCVTAQELIIRHQVFRKKIFLSP